MRRIMQYLLAINVLTLSAAPAAAGLITESLTNQPGSTDTTSVSGVSGQKLSVNIGTGVSLPNSSRFYGITEIEISELGNNKPCLVRVSGGALDADKGPDTRLLGVGELAGCGSSLVTVIDYKEASISKKANRFVRAVEVCNSKNKKNDRLKGLTLNAAHVQSNGNVIPEQRDTTIVKFSGGGGGGAAGASPLSDTFSRPNCDFFRKAAACDDDQIATGLVMHHNDGAFTGIALKCRKVKSGATRTLVKDSKGF